MAGQKEILGIWIGEAESASFWLGVCNDLKNRGVTDMLYAKQITLPKKKAASSVLLRP